MSGFKSLGLLVSACALVLWVSACGGDDDGGGGNDAAPGGIDAGAGDPDATFQSCGDGLVSGTEECDDSNNSDDDACLTDCTFACGDGVVNAVELCDTAISAGEAGACPTECLAPDACTTSVLSGDACMAECLESETTAFIDGDDCCPAGGNNNLDTDCPVICGNGARETGERCDTAIDAGTAGACPQESDCADALACTADAVANAGTCDAQCQNTEITTPADGDGCCPDGATSDDDDDCAGVCGDGVVTSPESCDTAIPAGSAGACPTAADCNDGVACTADNLVSGGTCNAACSNPAITDFVDGDGCCPAGGNANNDDDCEPECGNDVVEPGEECDDGGTEPGDGCDSTCNTELVPTAMRFKTLELRDPHPFTLVFGLICVDIATQLNEQFATAVTTDDEMDADDLLELSLVNVFRPLDQSGASTPMEIHVAACTAPIESTSCSPGDDPPIMSTATNQTSGTCLTPIAGTTQPYSPAVTNTTAPCYVSDAETLTLNIGDLAITLSDARIAGTYVGTPATGLVNGLVRGFISEAEADATILPDDIDVVGGLPLSAILPGGTDNCSSNDDRDTGPGGVTGWYMYLNFTADVVPWSEP